MKTSLKQRGSRFVLAAFLTSATQGFATPVDRSFGGCTFVDAVVTATDFYGAEQAGSAAEDRVNSATTALKNDRKVVRVPVNASGLGSCDVVQFSTETVGVNPSGSHRAATQKFIRLATVFENLEADDISVEQIFRFSLPTVGVASRNN